MKIFKKTLALLCALSLLTKSSAQNPAELAPIDSALQTTLPDSTRALLLSKRCFYLATSSPDTARKAGRQALALAQKIGSEKFMGIAESELGRLEQRQGNFADAKRFLESAIVRLRVQGLRAELLSATQNRGFVAIEEADFTTAFKCYEEVMHLAESIGDPQKIGYAHKNFAELYRAQKRHADAERELKTALEIFEKINKKRLALDCYISLGNIRQDLHDFEGGILWYKNGLKMAGDAATPYQVALTSENIGIACGALRRFDEAFEWFAKAEAYFEKLGLNFQLTYLFNIRGSNFLEKGDFKNAHREYSRALDMAMKNRFVNLEIETHADLEKLAIAQNDFKTAYEQANRAQTLRDSLRQTDRDRELLVLQTKFETAEKEKALQAKTLETARLRNSLIGGGFALAVAVLLAIGFWFRARWRRRTAEQLMAKNLEIEAARARAERSEGIKRQFLANMSHEIRTPLNALVGISNLLDGLPVPDEKTARYHEILQKSSETLLAIVNDILDFSKVEAGKLRLDPAPFNLPDLLHLVADMFRGRALEKGVLLETQLAPDLPQWVFADRHYLAQVLNNLLSNAIKFTPSGGSVVLKLENRNWKLENRNWKLENRNWKLENRNSKLEIEDSKSETGDGSNVQFPISIFQFPISNSQFPISNFKFSITDTGIGIPPEKISGIFEPFEQADAGAARKFGGTGLGLAISREIVALFGGQLQVKSSPGQGSEFWFEIALPEVQPPENQSFEKRISAKTALRLISPVRVLLAEDNAYNQVVATDSLLRLNPDFQISTAQNGREALQFLEKNTCDLLLLDVQMPEMDGYELAKNLRQHPEKRLRELPIIALTASVIKTDVERCLAAGMNGYVPKPFQLEDLAAEIVRLLSEKVLLVSPENLPADGKVFPKTETRNTVLPKTLTDFSAFEKLTADLPAEQRSQMFRLLTDGFAEKTAALETFFKTADRVAFAKTVHALRPLALSVGMVSVQQEMDELEINWSALQNGQWEKTAGRFLEKIRRANVELNTQFEK